MRTLLFLVLVLGIANGSKSFWHDGGKSLSWSQSKDECESLGKRLASLDDYCPDGFGAFKSRDGGPLPFDMWAPARDFNNAWVQIGRNGACATCKFYCNEKWGASGPGWGTIENHPLSYKSYIYCVTDPFRAQDRYVADLRRRITGQSSKGEEY
eukprot:gene2258-13175_t